MEEGTSNSEGATGINDTSSFGPVVPTALSGPNLSPNHGPQWQTDMYSSEPAYNSYMAPMGYQPQNQFSLAMQQSFSQSQSNSFYASQSFSSSQSYGMNSGVSYEEESSYQYMGSDQHGVMAQGGYSQQQGFNAQSGYSPQGYASQQAYAMQGGYGNQPMAQFERRDMQFAPSQNGQMMYQTKGLQYATDGNNARFGAFRNSNMPGEENGLGFSPRGLPIMDGNRQMRPHTPNMRSPSNNVRSQGPGSLQSYSPRPAVSYPNLDHQNSLGSNPDLSSPRSALSSPASASLKSPHPGLGSPRANLNSPMSTTAPTLNSPMSEIGSPMSQVNHQHAMGTTTPDGGGSLAQQNQQYIMRQQYSSLNNQNDFNSNYQENKKNMFSSKNLDGSIAAIELLTERHLGNAMQEPNFVLHGKPNGAELTRSQSVPAGHVQRSASQEKYLEKQMSDGCLSQENSNSANSNLGNATPVGAGSSGQSPRSIQGKQDAPSQSPASSWTSFSSPHGQNSPMPTAENRPISQDSASVSSEHLQSNAAPSSSSAQNSPQGQGQQSQGQCHTHGHSQTKGQGQQIQSQQQGQGQNQTQGQQVQQVQVQVKQEEDVKPFTPMSVGSQPSQSPKGEPPRPFSRGSSAMDSKLLNSPGTPSHSINSPMPNMDQQSPYMPLPQMDQRNSPYSMFQMNQGMGQDIHDIGMNQGMQGMNQMNQGISQNMPMKMNSPNDGMMHPQQQNQYGGYNQQQQQQQQFNQQQQHYNMYNQQQRPNDFGMFQQNQQGSGGGIPPISQMLSPPDMPPRWSNSPLVDLPSMGQGNIGSDMTSPTMDSSLPSFSSFPDDSGEYDFNEDDLEELNSEWNQHYQQLAFTKRKANSAPKGVKRKRKLKAKDGDCNQVVSLDPVDIVCPEGNDIASRFLILERQLCEELRSLKFRWPVTYIYNPIDYAWGAHSEFVRKYLDDEKKVLFIGMNPGPFGMAQSGVPFGEVNLVRDWLDVHGEIVKPTREHPKKPILGFDCTRKEVSGARFWGFFKKLCGIPQVFFRHVFVHNLCPLLFMNDNGRNLTPPDLPIAERRQLNEICHRNLCQVVRLLNIQIIVGIGKYAQERAKYAMEEAGLAGQVRVESILHPSPANPSANKGWEESAIRQLEELGLLPFFKPDSHAIS